MSKVIPEECRVALLAGGSSTEREISILSGRGAQEALQQAGFQVEWLDPADKADLKRLIEEPFDVAFLCLHGKKGEDGAIQGLLELLDIPYTCSGVLASATAMDKARAKVLYEHAGIPTPQSVLLKRAESFDVTELERFIGVPCVVKSVSGGSSIGVEIVEDASELVGAIDRVFVLDELVLVEKFVAGEELTVAVIGNDEPEPLPIIKIVPKGESYDFDSKYAPGGSQHICPAPLPDDMTELIQDYAVRAHLALGCRGVSRSDFIVDAAGQPWILETNTIPGMTKTSLLPDAACIAGYTFPELCTKLIEFALE